MREALVFIAAVPIRGAPSIDGYVQPVVPRLRELRMNPV